MVELKNIAQILIFLAQLTVFCTSQDPPADAAQAAAPAPPAAPRRRRVTTPPPVDGQTIAETPSQAPAPPVVPVPEAPPVVPAPEAPPAVPAPEAPSAVPAPEAPPATVENPPATAQPGSETPAPVIRRRKTTTPPPAGGQTVAETLTQSPAPPVVPAPEAPPSTALTPANPAPSTGVSAPEQTPPATQDSQAAAGVTANSGTPPANPGNATVDPGKTDAEVEARWASPNDAKIEPGAAIPTLRLGETKYTIFRKRVNWFRAHEYCRQHNLILAVFPTAEAYDEVSNLIFDISVFDPNQQSEFLGARRYWMGLNDLSGEGEWRWFDTGEKLTYTRFYPGQPDHITKPKDLTHMVRIEGKPAAHCGAIWNPKFETGERHVWDDSVCINHENAYHYFICQDYVETMKKY